MATQKDFEETLKFVDSIKEEAKKRKKLPWHRTYWARYNPAYIIFGTTACILAGWYGMFKAGLFYIYAGVASLVAGAVIANGVPAIFTKFARKQKGKLGRAFARLEVNYFAKSALDYFKKHYPNLMSAKDIGQISQNEFDDFVKTNYTIAKNCGKNNDKYIWDVINKRNKKDFNKIAKLAENGSSKSNMAKIKKILRKNKKAVGPWCELYNQSNQLTKQFFDYANKIDPIAYPEPDWLSYNASSEVLQAKIKAKLGINCNINDCTFDKTATNMLQNQNYPAENVAYSRIEKTIANSNEKEFNQEL